MAMIDFFLEEQKAEPKKVEKVERPLPISSTTAQEPEYLDYSNDAPGESIKKVPWTTKLPLLQPPNTTMINTLRGKS